MGDKKYSGNFYKADKIEETSDDCPGYICQNRKAKKDPDECPNCYHIPSKEKKEGQE